METYYDKAVQKAIKKIDKIVKKAFNKHKFENWYVETHKAKYEGGTFDNKQDQKARDLLNKCMDTFETEIHRGPTQIWSDACYKYNDKLRADGAKYRVKVFREIFGKGLWATPTWMYKIKVKITLLIDIRFLLEDD